MSDLLHYFKAQAETQAAKNLASYAHAKVELCQIYERLAELKSQHEPLASMANKIVAENPKGASYEVVRAALYSAAFFAVIGRRDSN